MEPFTPSWEVVELMGYAYYADRGFRILVPLVNNKGYDFVAEQNGNFVRVNVKLAGLKSKKLSSSSWSISTSGATTDRDILCCDEYLVFLPHKNRFITLPGDFFIGSKTKAKLLPKHLV